MLPPSSPPLLLRPPIVLSSSPPPLPTIQQRAGSSKRPPLLELSSSPPSLETLFRSFAPNSTTDALKVAGLPTGTALEKRATKGAEKDAQARVWDVPDDDAVKEDEPKARPERAAKKSTDAAPKKPRATKSKKAEKEEKERKAVKPNGTIKKRIVKKSFVATGATSKYFGGGDDRVVDTAAEKPKRKPGRPKKHKDDASAADAAAAPKGRKRRSSGDTVSLPDGQTADEPEGIDSGRLVAGMKHGKETDIERSRSASTSVMESSKATAPKVRIKKPAKKAQTITALATAKYRTDNEVSGSPITQYFPITGKNTSGNSATKSSVAAKPKVPAKRRKKAAEEEPDVPLLSPTSAHKRINEQQLVFGTCSQLEEGDTPDVPDVPEEADFAPLPPTSPSCGTTAVDEGVRKSAPGKKAAKRGSLWDAAVRDLDGGLLEVEAVDLTAGAQSDQSPGSPPVDGFTAFRPAPTLDRGRRRTSTPDPVPLPAVEKLPSALINISSSPHNPESPRAKPSIVKIGGRRSPSRAKALPGEPSTTKAASRSPARRRASPSPEPPSTGHLTTEATVRSKSPPGTKWSIVAALKMASVMAASRPRRADALLPPPMPDFSDWPTPDLQKALERYGFKPKSIRNRERLVDYVQRCWTAEHALPPSAPARSTSPKRARATSPKRVSKSPPAKRPAKRVRPRKAKPIAARQLSDEMHAAVSKAVMEHSVEGPGSFWFRILMYDPIIIEDLAAWLNGEGLALVGCEETVELGEVKEWCERHGVCCAARENNRGTKRKRL